MVHSTNITKDIKNLINEELDKIAKPNRRRGSYILTEQAFNGKTIINVDIQPEYESYLSFNLHSWIEFLNHASNNNQIVFLFNGADTLGMISESDYRMWLLENGLDEYVLDTAVFYDKGYAFFRYCMDSGIDEDSIVDLVKFMMNNDINDSRDIDEEMWNDFMVQTNHDKSDVRDLLEHADDMIHIPDLMEFLKNYNNIVLTGGGINECLKEVEIALMALNKPYNMYSKFTY